MIRFLVAFRGLFNSVFNTHTYSQDGVAFTVHFTGEARPPVEYEADSLEEKNKIFRLMTMIVDGNNGGRTASSADGPESGAAPVAVKTEPASTKIIREGRIEKKGHSVAYFHWQRFVGENGFL